MDTFLIYDTPSINKGIRFTLYNIEATTIWYISYTKTSALHYKLLYFKDRRNTNIPL